MTSIAQSPIYLDYAATTPVDPRVAEKMIPHLTSSFGNPASRSHAYGWQAEAAVETARAQVAELVGADPREIIWTSGATESDNLAIKGAAHFYRAKGNHLITLATEHKAVLDTMRELEREGFQVTYLKPQPNGLLDLETFKAALGPETILASIMLVNNEIGVIQDIAAGAVCRERGILFHVDAAQAPGKVAIDLETLPVDLMSFSAHKTYGPQGIGALYVRRRPRVHLAPLIHGGGHERGLRSGTLPTHQIVGMGEAYRLAGELMVEENARVRGAARPFPGRHRRHGRGLPQRRSGAARAPQPECQFRLRRRRVPDDGGQGIGGFQWLGLHLGEPGAVPCAAGAGRSDELAHSPLRITLGRYTTAQDIDFAVALLKDKVARLRALHRSGTCICRVST